MDHDEIFEDTWEDEENEWLLFLKDDVLSAAVTYVTYSKGMEELTRFGMKYLITLPNLANKNFISLREETDGPIYTYDDENVRYFVRPSIKAQ